MPTTSPEAEASIRGLAVWFQLGMLRDANKIGDSGLVERIERLPAHHIYTRVCDTNTAIDAAAQPHEIERMWRERFGLDEPALERAKRFLAEPAAWWISEEDGFVCCHHRVFPEFTLKAASAESDTYCNDEWTQGEVRTDKNYTGWYELRYHQTVLRRVRYVGFDNRKKDMVAPDYEHSKSE